MIFFSFTGTSTSIVYHFFLVAAPNRPVPTVRVMAQRKRENHCTYYYIRPHLEKEQTSTHIFMNLGHVVAVARRRHAHTRTQTQGD